MVAVGEADVADVADLAATRFAISPLGETLRASLRRS
jgi:hypothetical protein